MNRRAKRASAIALTGPSAALLIIGLWPREARAATLNVNTFEMTIKNDNLCSLPEAILSVNSKSGEDGCTKAAGDGTDVIQLQAATATNEYVAVPATSPMIIRRGVTIQGAGSNPHDGPVSLIYAYELTAANQALFEVDDSNGKMTVNFKNINLGGLVSPGQGGGTGAPVTGILGISNEHGSTITLAGLIVTNFQASGLSTDSYNLSVTQSDIEYNSTPNEGGGILYTDNAFYGTDLTITQSTVAYNTATVGGGIEYDGYGNSSVSNSTITYNSASNYAGVDLFSDGGSFAINSCTIAFNNCSNTYGTAGVEAVDNSEGAGVSYTMNATIVADNYDSDFTLSDLFSEGILEESNSMIKTFVAGTVVDEGNNFNGEDPGFGSVEANNAPTAYGGVYPLPVLMLSKGSPAIDRLTSLNGLTVDERGFFRPVNGKYDLGAFEYDPNTQGETLQVMATSNASASIVSGSNCPGCSNGEGLLLKSTSTSGTNSYAEYYELTSPANSDGFYDIVVNYATGPTEGTVQLQMSTNDSSCNFNGYQNVGGPLNLNATKDGFLKSGGYDYKVSLDLDSDCNYYFRFNLLSKSTAPNGVLVDYINLVFVKGD